MSSWVYDFEDLEAAKQSVGDDWDAVKALLGGKGANLADMASLGIPVPPGFTVTTEACRRFTETNDLPAELWDEVVQHMNLVEQRTDKTFGGGSSPLLVAVRSGAKISMPGMMDTVLNVGLSDAVAEAMVARTNDERFVFDSYRRLVQMFGSVVMGVDSDHFEVVLSAHRERHGVASDADLSAEAMREIVGQFKEIVRLRAGMPFPEDANEQLRLAIEAVFRSWNSKRAFSYRDASGIPHDMGTAVNVVAMVFGNTGLNSGTGVAMSRDGTTGQPHLEGDFLINAQGEDVVAGSRPTRPIRELEDEMPAAAAEFAEIARQLEVRHRDMQDLEFTIEDGRLWLLQTRVGKRTAQAAVRIAVDMANEGLIDRKEAIRRVSPEQIEFFLHPQLDGVEVAKMDPLTHGLNVSPGAAVGVIAFDPDLAERWGKEGRPVVLVRHETKPDDVHGMLAAVGILTSSGGRTSHAALVARQFGKPAVTGASDIHVDLANRSLTVGTNTLDEGDWVSIDGTSGAVFAGKVPTVDPDLDNEWLATLLEWADTERKLGIRANADDPVEAARARAYGAEGIGLCRTEHMFFAADRLPLMQRLITAPSPSEQREALDSLLPLQRADFAGLLRAMDGLPVIVRLLDPPLHEFLPSWEQLHRRTSDLQLRLARASGLEEMESLLDELDETRTMLARVDALKETNPMLGLRGVRLASRIPELTRMQTRALIEAACDVAAEGGDPRPEIMVPLVSHAGELERQRAVIEEVAAQVIQERGVDVTYLIGTMIEVPRAALTADEIAQHADFLSFGTNDLTQMTYAISRDDAEEAFLLNYMSSGLLKDNPFASIDRSGVGRLMQMAMTDAHKTKPTIESGVCGEHGGDPQSIEFCHQLGLDYVSCSVYRIPVARLAAAHAALAD